MFRCRALGHRYRFRAEGATLRWRCARGCGAEGAKRYDSAEQATRYARALDREDRDQVGRRAPLIGMLPLRIVHALRSARRHPSTESERQED